MSIIQKKVISEDYCKDERNEWKEQQNANMISVSLSRAKESQIIHEYHDLNINRNNINMIIVIISTAQLTLLNKY